MLKKLLIGTLVAAALLVGVGVSAAYDFGVATLKVGSKGEAVKTLQVLVGATPVDGSFGPLTKAKVMAWQANNGLTADGVFGPLSKSKANTVVVTSYPAGCTSAVGYSSTTGAKCDGSAVTTPVVSLVGQGDLSLVSTSTDVEDNIIEGKSNIKVLGFKAEGIDGDVNITSVKVVLENIGTGSYRLTRYVSNVSVFMGSQKLATVAVADFSRDGEVYTKSIALENAVVKSGSSNKETFYVTVDALSNIDSADLTADWNVKVTGARFKDASGTVMANTDTVSNTVGVETLANSGEVKLVVSKDTSSPKAQNVEVSDTGSTANVKMLSFKLKATGSDMSFDEVKVKLVGSSDVSKMVDELTLKVGSKEISNFSNFTTSATQDVTFNLDETYTVESDTTIVFTVYAKINDISNFSEGDSLIVSLPAITGVEAEDENGDKVIESGSATGEKQMFYSSGAQVSYVSSSYVAPELLENLVTKEGTILLSFKVTAFGDNDIVVKEDGSNLTFNLTGVTVSPVVKKVDSSLVSDAGEYTVSAGSDATFTLSVKINKKPTGFVQLELTNIGTTVVSNVKTSSF